MAPTDLDALAAEINAEEERTAHDTLHRARCQGERLLLAKSVVKANRGHGEWQAWLAANLRIPARTAREYMQVARRWDDIKTATVAVSTFADALRLLARLGREADPDDPGPEPEPVPAVALDTAGLPIPLRNLDVFAGLPLWDEAQRHLDNLKRLLPAIAAEPGGEVLAHQAAVPRLEDLANRLADARPFAGTCPHCQDDPDDDPAADCEECGGSGWVTKDAWDAAPARRRQALLAPLGEPVQP